MIASQNNDYADMRLVMKKILVAAAVLIMIHGSFMLCGAEIENRYINTKYFAIAAKYQLQGSLIYGSEPDKDSCGEGDNNYFEYKGLGNEINDIFNKISMIDSWSRLNIIKQRYINSPLLNRIKPSDFSKHHFAYIIIPFTGLQYIAKEQLIEKNNQIYFSYETWTQITSGPMPACAWSRLCVLKLKKKPI